MGHGLAILICGSVLAAFVQVATIGLAHELGEVADAHISCAPSSSFDQLLRVLNTDDACHIIGASLTVSEYHALDVLQKRILKPSDHLKST